MLSSDVAETMPVKNSENVGNTGKVTKGRMITWRVSLREHSPWNAVRGGATGAVGAGITEGESSHVARSGSLRGPSKEGRVGLEKPRRMAKARFQQTHQFTTKQRHATRSYTDYYITNVHRHILHMRSPSDTHAHVHTHYSLTFTPATLRSQYRVEPQHSPLLPENYVHRHNSLTEYVL